MNKVYIHIGPPKSGSSAIQKWLNENRDYLLSQDVFYPEHQLDENGVSSGNLLSLFSREGDDYTLDSKKLALLMKRRADSGASRLLLSSEFFFKRMEQLAIAIPDAIFIGYLRFPLDVAESSYNQGVKRHAQIHAFGLPKSPRAYQLELLDKLIKQIGSERFILRPYHASCFFEGKLVSDFLRQLQVPAINVSDKKVNSSYTLEGLEFKRWFNQLDLESLQMDMDRFLQREQNGTSQYSMIPSSTFELFKGEFVNQLRDFCDAHNVADREKFIQHCEAVEQKHKVKQVISDEVFATMLAKFLKEPGVLKKMVTAHESSWKYQKLERSPERMIIVESMLPASKKFAYKVRRFLGQS